MDINYRQILENCSDIILQNNNSKLLFQYINPEIESTLGIDYKNIRIKRVILKKLDPEDRVKLYYLYKKHIAEKLNSFSLEIKIETKNGFYSYFEIACKTFYNASAGVSVSVIHLKNTEDQRKIEDELVEGQRLLSSIITAIPDIVFILDIETIELRYSNKNIPSYLGYSISENSLKKNKFLNRIMEKNTLVPFLRYLVTRRKTNKITEKTLKLKHRNQTEHWFYVRDIPFLYENGKVKQILGIAHDITSRKQTEYRLLRQSHLIFTLFDNSPIPMAIFDSKGYLFKYNEARKKFFNLPDLEYRIGSFNIFHNEYLNQLGISSKFTEAYNGSVVTIQELILNTEENPMEWCIAKKVCIDLVLYPIKVESGNIEFVIAVFNDITQRKRYEDLLQKKERYLKAIVNIQNYLLSITNQDYYDIMYILGDLTLADRISFFTRDSLDENYLKLSALWKAKAGLRRFEYKKYLKLNVSINQWESLFFESFRFQYKLSKFRKNRKYSIQNEKGRVLLYPVFLSGKLKAVLCYEKFYDSAGWDKIDQELLKIVSSAISLFEEKKEIEYNLIKSEKKYRSIAQENKHLLELSMQDSEKKALLLEEVNHRVRNNLTSILGILELETKRAFSSMGEYEIILENLNTRIKGISDVHDILSEMKWALVPIEKLIKNIAHSTIESLSKSGYIQFNYKDDGKSIFLNSKKTTAIGMIINELVTNSIKHGFINNKSGMISISVFQGEQSINMEYRDNGLGFPQDVLNKNRANVGLKIIQLTIVGSLRGQIKLFNDSGAVIFMSFANKA